LIVNRVYVFFLTIAFVVSIFLFSTGSALFAKESLSSAELEKMGLKSPAEYGSIVLDNKTGEGKAMPAVVFPHWWHRTQFTCKVCHLELGFPMKAGETDFVMGEIFAGKQCGACHNGSIAFMPMDCARCHSQGQDVPQNRKIEEELKALPKDDFGNKVDWVKAIRDGSIKPKATLDGTGEMMVVDLDIDIPVTKFTPHPPDVVYPHKAHTEWLDCSNCHTAIFNMQKGGNPEMNMMKIISGQYCGVCHGKVAFPLENCYRCHSADPKPIEDLFQVKELKEAEERQERIKERDRKLFELMNK
jgi:c(7)-type cytochrome triheme protein